MGHSDPSLTSTFRGMIDTPTFVVGVFLGGRTPCILKPEVSASTNRPAYKSNALGRQSCRCLEGLGRVWSNNGLEPERSQGGGGCCEPRRRDLITARMIQSDPLT